MLTINEIEKIEKMMGTEIVEKIEWMQDRIIRLEREIEDDKDFYARDVSETYAQGLEEGAMFALQNLSSLIDRVKDRVPIKAVSVAGNEELVKQLMLEHVEVSATESMYDGDYLELTVYADYQMNRLGVCERNFIWGLAVSNSDSHYNKIKLMADQVM